MNAITSFAPPSTPLLTPSARRRSCSSRPPPQAKRPSRKRSPGPKREPIDLMPKSRPVIKASWRGRVLAESSDYLFLDGRFYFPHDHVDWSLLSNTEKIVHKNPYGKAEWHDLCVDGQRNRKAAWRFGRLRRPYKELEGFTSFWKGVKVKQEAVVATAPWSEEILMPLAPVDSPPLLVEVGAACSA